LCGTQPTASRTGPTLAPSAAGLQRQSPQATLWPFQRSRLDGSITLESASKSRNEQLLSKLPSCLTLRQPPAAPPVHPDVARRCRPSQRPLVCRPGALPAAPPVHPPLTTPHPSCQPHHPFSPAGLAHCLPTQCCSQYGRCENVCGPTCQCAYSGVNSYCPGSTLFTDIDVPVR